MSALLELLKQKKQDLSAGKRRKTIKPADGTGRYRILPSWRGAGQQFWHDFGQHFIKDSTGTLKAVYMCTDKTFGKPCAVCDAVGHAIKGATDDATMEIMKEAKSAGRVLLNALHMDSTTPGEIQILELPPTVFEQIINIAQEWEEAGQSIFDPATGRDLVITRTGTGKNTKYSVQASARQTALPAGVDLAKLHNLDEYVQQESSEAQLRALNSVRAAAGLLPAPAASSGLPAAAAAAGAASLADDDLYATATPPARPAPAAAPAAAAAIDVEAKVVKPAAPAPAPAAAAPAPAPAAAVADAGTGDPELDNLLANLG